VCWLYLEVILDLCNTYSSLSYQKYMFLQLFGYVLYVTVQLYMLPDYQQDEIQSVSLAVWLYNEFKCSSVHVTRIYHKMEYSLCPCCFIM